MKRVNRFLQRERYEPQDLFNAVKPHINLVGGILSVDDTVIEKPYSDPKQAELIGYFWSGKHHQVIKGINLITLYHCAQLGNSIPISYRIYDKQSCKTSNDYFREMMTEVLSWGLQRKDSHRRQLVFRRRESEVSKTPKTRFSLWG